MASPALAEALTQLPLALAAFDEAGRVTQAAGGGYELMGLKPADTVGVSLLSSPTQTALAHAVSRALEGQSTSFAMEFDGHWWQCHVVPTASGGGYVLGTEAVDAAVGAERLEQVLASAPVCVAGFDLSGTITYASGSGYLALGLEPEATVGRSMFDLYGDSQVIVDSIAAVLGGVDSDIVTEYGGRVWHLHYRAVLDGARVSGGLCTAQDVTTWAADSGRPVTTPTVDPKVDLLTGLLSRQAIAEGLTAPKPGEQASAVLVDLDAFAVLNEAYGHATGDTVLVAVADRLRYVAGTRWQVGRWGDDVFALVHRGPESTRESDAMVARIASVLSGPIDDGAARLQVTASIGVASTDHSAMAELLACAALAVRAAKQAGRDQAQRYTSRLQPLGARAPRLAAELRAGLELDQVGLHYQPIVRLADRRATGVEALARWAHPERGLLMPVHFIPLAERSGLIVPLGERLMRQACHTAAAWQHSPPCDGPLQVAINLSARQLTHPGLLAMVRDALTVSGCDPTGLAVEVTETAVMSDLDVAVATLRSLKDLGLGIALDDFGTGHSSLVYLKRFPVDTLKIDASFVAGLGKDSDDTAIVTSLISLSHSVGVTCVAEGVETAEQLAMLESMGCDHAQGYVFGRALDPPGITTWLSRQRRPAQSRRTPDPSAPAVEADTLDRVRVLHGEGASLHTIAARLNVEGRRTAKGTRWHHTTVAQVIAALIAQAPR